MAWSSTPAYSCHPHVGASLLAKKPRWPRGVRLTEFSLTTIASKLAPTGLSDTFNPGIPIQKSPTPFSETSHFQLIQLNQSFHPSGPG
ncbi:hypothetical protein EMIT0P218_130002 [Pseudomonas sp. IT-P218]